MLPEYTPIGGFTLLTYTLILTCGLLCSAACLLWTTRKVASFAARVDVLLGILFAALLLGRVLHVALHWAHFSLHMDEIWRLNAGGLDWHGAVLGASIGLWLGARWRKVTRSAFTPALLLAVPLLTIATWLGCESIGCAYGAELTTLAGLPQWLASEARDRVAVYAPRYNTHMLGAMLGIILLLIAALLLWRGWLPRIRLPLLIALLAAGMFAIGFLRGDYAVYAGGLRLDQWLDLGTIAVCAGVIVAGRGAGIMRSPLLSEDL